MPRPGDLMGAGMPPLQAAELGNEVLSINGAGTTQATATLITSHMVAVTAASSQTGAILPIGGLIGTPYFVASVSGTAAKIYCPVGHTLNGTSNGGATFSTATGLLIFIQTSRTVWFVTGTATASVA